MTDMTNQTNPPNKTYLAHHKKKSPAIGGQIDKHYLSNLFQPKFFQEGIEFFLCLCYIAFEVSEFFMVFL